MKKLLYILAALCLCSCDQKEEVKEVKLTEPVKAETKPARENNDKYVYIDALQCLHTDKSCIEMLPITYTDVSAETTARLRKIQYIEKTKLMSNDFGGYCSDCTEIEDYEEIEDIVRVNENRRKAYDLLDRHFNMPPYNEFYTMLNGEEGRKKAYNSLIENNHKELGRNYEEFLNNICPQNQLQDDYWEQFRCVYKCSDVYHSDENCVYLKDRNQVSMITLGEAKKQTLKPCEHCN